jgi:hypothetical protein
MGTTSPEGISLPNGKQIIFDENIWAGTKYSRGSIDCKKLKGIYGR